MVRNKIEVKELNVNPHHIWNDQWFLLTCGDFAKGEFNTMTVAWGSFGTMWHKPFAQIVVRPTRYTYEFTEKYDNFTLTAFPEEYKKALSLLGSKSGRDLDKIKESGLTPIASKIVSSPGFAEAELIIECKKIYWDDFKPEQFLDPVIEKSYPDRDYHRAYFGEMIYIEGTAKFK